jgi:hypothetical protein
MTQGVPVGLAALEILDGTPGTIRADVHEEAAVAIATRRRLWR